MSHLVLIHYPTPQANLTRLVAEAQSAFGGPATLAEDYMRLDW
jgi:ribonuclease BN (tRNA processing enzyme)